jgi:hypothetical protein
MLWTRRLFRLKAEGFTSKGRENICMAVCLQPEDE